MRRHLRIYRTFFLSSLVRELEFKANFFAKIVQNLVWVVFFSLIVAVIYRNTDSVAGWNRGDSFVLASTVFLLIAVCAALTFSLYEIPEQVRRGTLDFVVTKPVDSQFWVSLRRFNFDEVGTFVAGLVMLGYGVATSGRGPGLEQFASYTVLTVSACVIYYSFMLALMTLGIWLVRVDNLWVLGETVTQVARFPLDIFSSPLQRALTFIVPLAFIAYVPALQLVRGTDWPMAGLGVLWAIAFFLGSRAFWRFAMSHYTSASS